MRYLFPLLLLFLPLSLEAGPSDHDAPKLYIGGGGVMGGLHEHFLKLAEPDARLIVFPSPEGSPDVEAIKSRWQNSDFEKVAVLHTADREEADSRRFARQLEFATAVWFEGGVQQHYAAAYAGTETEAALIELLDRGGVIGGSSAGASIQTKAMICGGTVNPQVLSGLDLLQGAIVDQHFLKRNRLPRLMGAVRDNPKLVGYGIDEGTALVVDDGQMRVAGRSYVIRIKMVDRELQIDAFREGDVLPLPKDEPR